MDQLSKHSLVVFICITIIVSLSSGILDPIIQKFTIKSYSYADDTKQIQYKSVTSETPLLHVKVRLNNVIYSMISTKKITKVGVYFYDLKRKESIDINGDEQFSPGSLYKLMTATAVLKKAEQDNSLLGKKIEVKGKHIPKTEQKYPPPDFLKQGETYIVNDLLFRQLAYSDNTAERMLASELGLNKTDRENTFSAYNIQTNNSGDTRSTISPKEYSNIFISLFNAEYLNQYFSDYLLQLITESTFKEGLVKGLPDGTLVAHKFGEKTTASGYGLHDCGIIYKKDNPYVLCIMTNGTNFENLENAIQEISKIIYFSI